MTAVNSGGSEDVNSTSPLILRTTILPLPVGIEDTNDDGKGVSTRCVVGLSVKSRNVWRVMTYQLLDGVCFSVWQYTVLQLFVYQLAGNSNEVVGWLSGAMGIAQVISAGAGSYYADKLNRELLMRVAAVLGIAAVAASIAAVALLELWMMFAGAVLWGYYTGLSNPAAEALFADSVTSGKRSKVYTHKWMLQSLSGTVGCLVGLILFLAMGNTWQMHVLQTVMYCGLGLHPIAILILFAIRDRHSLGKESEGMLCSSSDASTVSSVDLSSPIRPTSPCLPTTPLVTSKARKTFLGFSWRHVPALIICHDLVIEAGSGMTMRYFSLFFVNVYKVPPALLSVVILIASFATAIAALVSREAATCIGGRMQTMIAVRVIGTAALYALALSPGLSAGGILTLYVVRYTFMNCIGGIAKSVVMDYVPKRERARWSAAASLDGCIWAFSAVLGGYLVDSHGYLFSFLITAVIHSVAIVLLIPAMVLVRDEEHQQRPK